MCSLTAIVVGGVAMSGIALVGSVTLLFNRETLDRILGPLVAFAAGSRRVSIGRRLLSHASCSLRERDFFDGLRGGRDGRILGLPRPRAVLALASLPPGREAARCRYGAVA